MTRRTVGGVPLWLVVTLSGGFVGLVVGLAALFGIFLDERDEALAQVDANRATLEAMAGAELREELTRRLEGVDAEVEAAVRDPYLPARELVLIEDGVTLLPRRTRPRGDSEARAALDWLDGAGPRAPRALDEVVRERVALATAAAAGPDAYAAWLDHRARFAVRVDLDLATTLWAIERLDTAGALDPARATELLRDGVARRDRPVPALLAALLEARGRISGGDFEALLARSVPLAKRYLVRVDDVVARAREGPILPSDDDAEDPGFDPDDRSRLARLAPADGSPGAEFDGAGAFAVRRAGEHRVVGRWVDLAAWRDRLRDRLVASGRIDRDARLAFETEPLGVEIASSAWSEATALARRRFLWKAIPLGVVALLGALVFTLAVLLQRRRAAYIDLRSHLLAAVTHELKTPLASIRALAETLEMRVGAMPEARDYPARIIGSTERLGFLVDNVLSFARLERGAWKARFAPIAVADLAGWMAGDLAPRAARPVDVTSAIDADLALVADPDLVRLMLSNLVDNAAKYAVAERVAVRFAATADRHGVHLVVSDDGPGLGVRDPARLFEEFERGAVEGVRGTGLGLSICRQVMRLHGGTIRVLATSPRGTSFEAVFPHRPQAPHHPSEGVEPAATRPLGHPEEGFEP